ncbi:hypothetical protein COLO4_16489 [Corchorus olitorius]|uniref:Uncharacterized protein n=1 Tax=Corchorus olitorius TaxID=93759 RepID=A0A1R3JH63_9ROSI|nr:hypothetical protein COLO4_16489 [Corchorus olitorius]
MSLCSLCVEVCSERECEREGCDMIRLCVCVVKKKKNLERIRERENQWVVHEPVEIGLGWNEVAEE